MATPAQIKGTQYFNPQSQKFPSYAEWLAMRGESNPYSQYQQQPQGVDFSQLISKGAESDFVNDALFSSGGGGAIGAGGGTTFASGTTVAGEAIGTAANGGTMMSTGAIVPASEGAPLASAGAEAAGMFDLAGIGSAGNAILPVAGAFGAYDLFTNDRGKGRGFAQGAASGAAIGSYFGPQGALIGAGIGGAVGFGKGLLAHKSTREVAKDHTKELQDQFKDDATYQAYVRGMREQHNSAPPDPSKPFAGKYRTWDEYKKAGLEASDLTGVYGNLKTFGKDWSDLSFDQRRAVTQALIDADLYKSKKGEVEITDSNKAKQLFKDIAGGGFKIPKAPKPGQTLDARMAVEGRPTLDIADRNREPVPPRGEGIDPGNRPLMIPKVGSALDRIKKNRLKD